MQLKNRKKTSGGWTMTEVMVATALGAVVLSTGMAMRQTANDQERGRSTAELMSSFQQIAVQYFTANRPEIDAAMAGDAAMAAKHCLINVAADGSGGTVSVGATNRTCAFDATNLRAKGVWPVGLQINAGSGRFVAITRQIMNAGTRTGAVDMLIVKAAVKNGNVLTSGAVTSDGDLKHTMEELQAGATSLGGAGGYIPAGKDYGPCQYNATVKQACGSTWSVNLADFLN